MYRTYDSVNCTPPMFYRDPEVIKRDIRSVISRISEINEFLNVRELVARAMDSDERIVRYAEAMGELYEYADEAREELSGLSETLDLLKEEFILTMENLI